MKPKAKKCVDVSKYRVNCDGNVFDVEYDYETMEVMVGQNDFDPILFDKSEWEEIKKCVDKLFAENNG